MKKIIFCFVLFFMLAACNEKTNFQGRYVSQEIALRVIKLEKINDVEYKLTEEPNELDKVLNTGKPATIVVKIKNSNQLFDSHETYLGEFKENKDLVDNKGRVYKKVE